MTPPTASPPFVPPNVNAMGRRATVRAGVPQLIRESADSVGGIDQNSLAPLLDRCSDARLVLLGEATHGTSEFYRMRACITRALIQHHHFDFLAVEADWPDAATVNDHVRGAVSQRSPHEHRSPRTTPFARFPVWMWRNEETAHFVKWLREWNVDNLPPSQRVGFHGLDLYSMFASAAIVLEYLEAVDADAALLARQRFASLTRWQDDPSGYARAVISGRCESAEDAVCKVLCDLLARQLEDATCKDEPLFDAVQNARVVAHAEQYYRAMYQASPRSWNLRDSHMFEVLEALLAHYGPEARGIVWEHNSHIGNALATEMSQQGQLSLGQLCRQRYGNQAYLVGFGTNHGSVMAAPAWGSMGRVMAVRDALEGSYERLFHDSQVPALSLPLREPVNDAVRDELMTPRLERAIGVVYRPQSERASHYFSAALPEQFDEFVWVDETHAVTPLSSRTSLTED